MKVIRNHAGGRTECRHQISRQSVKWLLRDFSPDQRSRPNDGNIPRATLLGRLGIVVIQLPRCGATTVTLLDSLGTLLSCSTGKQ